MRTRSIKATRARQHLDPRLETIRPLLGTLKPPSKGWIRAIREGLGMTATQLARRLRVTQATLSTLELSETRGTIQIDTLRRVADAMNCTLVYALVPAEPLEKIVQDRARSVASKQLQPIQHSMRLENQELAHNEQEKQLADYIRNELDPRRLWDRP
jgi:predicted DNA-binding mobile mystery protein A